MIEMEPLAKVTLNIFFEASFKMATSAIKLSLQSSQFLCLRSIQSFENASGKKRRGFEGFTSPNQYSWINVPEG